jgi:mannitol/fructose-specific phosphotransferase system IIA component (Ntr-type)
MGSPAKVLAVPIVFVLAVCEIETQTVVLQGLMNILSNEGALKKLRAAKRRKDVIEVLQSSEAG